MLGLFSSSATLITCLIIGAVLIVVEALTPGLSLPGLIGSILLFMGSVLAWYNYGLTAGLIVLLCSLLFTVAAVLLSLRSASRGKLSKSPIVLSENTLAPELPNISALIGQTGKAVTPLNPVGEILLDGKRIDVLSADGFIAKDTNVKVSRTEGNKVFVSKCD